MTMFRKPQPGQRACRTSNVDSEYVKPVGFHVWHPASFETFDDDGNIPTEAVAYCGARPVKPIQAYQCGDGLGWAKTNHGNDGYFCQECCRVLAEGDAFTESWQRAFRAEHGL